MKHLAAVLVALLIATSFTACSSKPARPAPGSGGDTVCTDFLAADSTARNQAIDEWAESGTTTDEFKAEAAKAKAAKNPSAYFELTSSVTKTCQREGNEFKRLNQLGLYNK